MLCGEIMRQAGQISDTEWSLFLRGPSGVEKVCLLLLCRHITYRHCTNTNCGLDNYMYISIHIYHIHYMYTRM